MLARKLDLTGGQAASGILQLHGSEKLFSNVS